MGIYTHTEQKEILKNLTVLVDTREQETDALKRRLEGLECPSRRTALSYGDYSAESQIEGKELISLQTKCVIERKMNIDEICGNFTKGRERFAREFERALNDGCQVHLIIEGCNWEKIFNGGYKSQLTPQALTASLLCWLDRYNFHLHFCKAETTPRLIYKILYYAMKKEIDV